MGGLAPIGAPGEWAPRVSDVDDPERWVDRLWSAEDSSAAPDVFPSAGLLARAAEGELGAADLLSVLDALGREELALLDADARVDAVRGWERLGAMVAARQQDAIAAVADATEDLGLDPAIARHEIGAALGLAPLTADQRGSRWRCGTGCPAPGPCFRPGRSRGDTRRTWSRSSTTSRPRRWRRWRPGWSSGCRG